MGDAIVINSDTFFERLGHLYTAWKADKRGGDALYGGAESLVVLTGKAVQENSYLKNNAFHVSNTAYFAQPMPDLRQFAGCR